MFVPHPEFVCSRCEYAVIENMLMTTRLTNLGHITNVIEPKPEHHSFVLIFVENFGITDTRQNNCAHHYTKNV